MGQAAQSGRRRAPGLLAQIALALLAVGTVPLAVAGLQLMQVNRAALVDQLLRTHTVAARTAADQIDAFIGARRALLEALAADPRLAAPNSPPAQELLADTLAAWAGDGIGGLAVHDPDGALSVRVQSRQDAAAVEQLLLERPELEPRFERLNGELWYVAGRDLDRAAGRLALASRATAIARALMPDELGEQARLILLDTQGRAVGGDAQDSSPLPAALTQAALAGRLSGAGRFGERGSEIVGAWSAIEGGSWIIISTQPATIAEAAARRMARRSAIALVVALLLTALLSWLAWRRLVRPLRALLAAERQMAGLRRTEAPGSETRQLETALGQLEQRRRDRAAIEGIFLGRYQVIEILGSGGMGTVFRGWDPRLQRPVALKTMHPEASGAKGDRAASSHILAEAIRAAQIRHPNVVAVYDAETSGEVAYVAMEYVDGVSLDRYLEERGALTWQEAIPLARHIAAALAAAHAIGLVHRDVKPGNVLLAQDGAVRLADFGLATWLELRTDTPGKVFGTPGFLAPEVLRGHPYDWRADLYALGVLLFRAIFGRYPFRGTTFREIVRSTVHDAPPQIADLGVAMPTEFATLLQGLLARRPADRPAPTHELAARLGHLADQHQLVWRLDFTRRQTPIEARVVFPSVTLPTVPEPEPPRR